MDFVFVFPGKIENNSYFLAPSGDISRFGFFHDNDTILVFSAMIVAMLNDVKEGIKHYRVSGDIDHVLWITSEVGQDPEIIDSGFVFVNVVVFSPCVCLCYRYR